MAARAERISASAATGSKPDFGGFSATSSRQAGAA